MPSPSERLTCILTYCGSQFDSILNYFVLVVATAYFVMSTQSLPQRRRIGVWIFNAIAYAGLWVFQISLCFGVNCDGISIVWAALFGAGIVDYLCFLPSPPPRVKTMFYSMVCLCCGAVLYYGITQPLDPTTTAHVCAILLGLCIGLVKNRTLSGYAEWCLYGHAAQHFHFDDDVDNDVANADADTDADAGRSNANVGLGRGRGRGLGLGLGRGRGRGRGVDHEARHGLVIPQQHHQLTESN